MSRPRASVDVGMIAAERIQYLLGLDTSGLNIESHDLLCEMMELVSEVPISVEMNSSSHNGEQSPSLLPPNASYWTESARWIKFEEDVEEGGDRWSKPHVATLCLQSLFELRSCIQNGTVMFNVQAPTFDKLVDCVSEKLATSRRLSESDCEVVRNTMLLRQVHFNERSKMKVQHALVMPIIRSLAEISKKHSSTVNMPKEELSTTDSPVVKSRAASSSARGNMPDPSIDSNGNLSSSDALKQCEESTVIDGSDSLSSSQRINAYDAHFMRKIPSGSEVANILIGEAASLQYPIVVFVHLAEAVIFPGLAEVPLATRFLFLLLGPPANAQKHREIGRCIGTLLSDEVFREIAYRSRYREDLLIGIDEFLSNVTVLPPGEWDPSIRIEPPQSIPSQDGRKTGAVFTQNGNMPNGAMRDLALVKKPRKKIDPSFIRTGRIFGGLINDVKNKLPWFVSDFKDALDMKCLAATIFLYFAALSPAITFGAMLRNGTGAYMATVENILSGAVCGVIYALFSGQPLTLLSSTGPVLVFEKIVYQFSRSQDLDFLAFRFWICMWSMALLVFIVAFDISAYVRYITRFTEESFACLISLIFIWEALVKVCEAPVLPNLASAANLTSDVYGIHGNATRTPTGEEEASARAATYFSLLLFLGTFLISWSLRKFDKSRFFAHRARSLVTDFSVVIAIVIMSVIEILVGSDVEKLDVPSTFQPTNPNRQWIVDPFRLNLVWILAAVLPAMLAVILIFMDQQITSVIVNRKQNKLKKGHGYHLDLLVIGLLVALCGLMGLPIYVAATVLSINHVMCLKRTSKCTAPGEVPKFLGCREQRATALVISLLIGLSVLLTSVLKHIPMPVLYGVFLYMGISSLEDLDLIRRLSILFMPGKYQPDLLFLRRVPLRRVHLFTLIQVVCLGIMWALKSIEIVSIGFPITVLAMCFVRKSMDFVFTQQELRWLDDIIPSSSSCTAASADVEAHKDEEDYGSDNDTKTGTVFGSTSTMNSDPIGRPRRTSVTNPLIGASPSSAAASTACSLGTGVGNTGLALGGGSGAGVSFSIGPTANASNDFYNINITDQVTNTTIWRQLSASSNPEKRDESERRNSHDASKRNKEKRESLSKGTQPRKSYGESLMNRMLQTRRKTFAGDKLAEHVELTKLLLFGKELAGFSPTSAGNNNNNNNSSNNNHSKKKTKEKEKDDGETNESVSPITSRSPSGDFDRRMSMKSQSSSEGVSASAIATSGAGASASGSGNASVGANANVKTTKTVAFGVKPRFAKKPKAARKSKKKQDTFAAPQIVIEPPSEGNDFQDSDASDDLDDNDDF